MSENNVLKKLMFRLANEEDLLFSTDVEAELRYPGLAEAVKLGYVDRTVLGKGEAAIHYGINELGLSLIGLWPEQHSRHSFARSNDSFFSSWRMIIAKLYKATRNRRGA